MKTLWHIGLMLLDAGAVAFVYIMVRACVRDMIALWRELDGEG